MTDPLAEATALIKAGKMAEAQEILHPFIRANPQNVDAWLLETETWNTAGKIRVLQICLEHNPANTRAQQALRDLLTSHQERLLRLARRGPTPESASEANEEHPADEIPPESLSARFDRLARELEQSRRLMEQAKRNFERLQAEVNSLRQEVTKLEAERRPPD